VVVAPTRVVDAGGTRATELKNTIPLRAVVFDFNFCEDAGEPRHSLWSGFSITKKPYKHGKQKSVHADSNDTS